MKTIALGLQKGGVGKTSISLALAYELANNGKKVLIVDADPQGNTTQTILSSCKKEFADVLFENCDITEAIEETKNENLFVLPTFSIGTRLREYKISGKVSQDVFKVKQLLKKISPVFDYTIIDTSPDFSTFEMNVFYACDEIIPVINCDSFAVDGLTIFTDNINKFKERMERENLEIKTVIINRYNASMSIDKDLREIFMKKQGYNFITIPQDQAFRKSQLEQKEMLGKQETINAIKELAKLC